MLLRYLSENVSELTGSEFLPFVSQLQRLAKIKRWFDTKSKRGPDFLSKIASNNSALIHSHNIEQWGLKFWLPLYALDSEYDSMTQAQDGASQLVGELKYHQRFIKNLSDSDCDELNPKYRAVGMTA